jgi:uncharacterized protein YunC (DUF1805 family)
LKTITLLIATLMLVSLPSVAGMGEEEMNWDGLVKEKISLQLPLLIIKGSKGFLACAYVDVEICNKTGESCAIVSGVKSHDDMLGATVRFVSDAAQELGVKEGMSGKDAIELLR